MAKLTIQISDELAGRLEPVQNRLPELLWRLVDIEPGQTTQQPQVSTEAINIPEVYQEVLDFFMKLASSKMTSS
ncbi:hypothetical protein [Chlorogloeopsis sp. ULAP02]|uniref:hypothetical protein n=1 Tax=Chlorogloeopsis sp. ULAP02 TaxID=3107926 RepID=UPI0031364D36